MKYLGGLQFVTFPHLYACEPDWEWSPPELRDYDFWAVLEGRGELHVNHETFDLQAGSGFLLCPGDRLNARHEAKNPLKVIAFHFLPKDGFPWQADYLPRQRQFQDLATLHVQAELAARYASHSRPDRRLRGTLAALQLLAHFADGTEQSPESMDTRIETAAQNIRSAPSHVTSIAALAKQAGVTPAHFSRIFKHKMGVSPQSYVKQAKADRARWLVEETLLPLKEIADMLGYADVYHFSKQFRARHGRPPGQWRSGKSS